MIFLVLVIVTFFLHLLWESMHIRLYRGYDALKGMLPVPVWASLGDVVYTLIAIILVAFFKSNLEWFQSATLLDYVGLAAIGFHTAIFVEYKAFYFKRWEYTEHMPVVPVLRVGVSSLIQKTLLFPLSVWVTTVVLHLISTSL